MGSRYLLVGSLAFASAYALALAGALGATVIGKELREGRLSFYFSRPLSGTALWFGKLLAAAILLILAFGIVALPVFLSGGHELAQWTGNPFVFPAAVLGLAAVVFFVAHGLATTMRSPWVALDAAC